MTQKICLITGGAGFLGRKYCEYFIKKNFKVLCIDNNKENLKKIKSLKLKNLTTYKCDITNHSKVEKLFKSINKFFFVDVLVNNAAIDAIPFKKNSKIQKFPTNKMWDNELDVSLKGSFHMIKFFGEEMALNKLALDHTRFP